LGEHFGPANIFYDQDSIPIGRDFVEYLDERISQCGVLLALIGKRWLEVKNKEGGNRLFDKDDIVQAEIASALERGITVIPVLVEKAEMPVAEELPSSLKQLARKHASEVGPGMDFEYHTDRLIKGLGKMGIKPLAQEEAVETIEPSRQNQGLPKAKTAKSKSWWSWLPWVRAKNVVCPNCFCPFDTSQLQFRCTNKKCAPENDSEHARFLGVHMLMGGRVIIDPGCKVIEAGKSSCPACADNTTHLICPQCHAQIPHNSWQNPDFICSLMGAVGAGKSLFISVFLKHLYEESAKLMGAGTTFDFSTIEGDRVFKKNRDAVFFRNEQLETTQKYSFNSGLRIPFIGTLKTWRYKEGGYSSKETLKSNLVMYDNAGEDFNSQDDGAYFKRILHSNALVFVVDSLSFPIVGQMIKKTTGSTPSLFSVHPPEDLIRNIYNTYCRQHPNMNIGDKIKAPLAVVLNKLDLAQDLLSPDSKIARSTSHEAGVDMENLQQASEEGRSFIDGIGGAALNNTISERFENFMYFGVSIGRDAQAQDGSSGFEPFQHRILDPMVWLMHQHDLISTKPPAPNGEG